MARAKKTRTASKRQKKSAKPRKSRAPKSETSYLNYLVWAIVFLVLASLVYVSFSPQTDEAPGDEVAELQENIAGEASKLVSVSSKDAALLRAKGRFTEVCSSRYEDVVQLRSCMEKALDEYLQLDPGDSIEI